MNVDMQCIKQWGLRARGSCYVHTKAHVCTYTHVLTTKVARVTRTIISPLEALKVNCNSMEVTATCGRS